MKRLTIALVLLLAGGTLPAQSSANPHGSIGMSCSTCHAPDGWKPLRISADFQHAPKSFPLEGAHAQTSCTGCHQRLDFKGVSPTCASCHEDVHKGELGADCARCHTTRGFNDNPSMRRAHEETRFPLRGAHAAARCTDCHVPSGAGQMQFVNRATTCISCHATAARAVAYPDHQAAGFTTECTACHAITSWKGARFDHASTAFPLVGAHIAATCADCHADRVYRGKDTQCVSCHRPDYDQARSPLHTDGFPTSCADCHGNTEWKGARFDHQATRFPLEGAHNAATCAGCHGSGTWRGTPTDCASCHTDDYSRTRSPPHAAAGFATTCASCHRTTAWLGQPFDHTTTRFALTGAHLAASCTGCHADNVYKGRSMECTSCHQADYAATRNPPHGAAGFTAPCTSCHTTAAWAGAVFDHGTTRFPLSGAHRATTCAGCHADGTYRGKPTTCVSCHRPEYDGTTNPPHRSGFPTTCESCHATAAWTGATFDHAATAFALTGAHAAVSCSGCHADGVFDGKPTECIACHRTDYDGTTAPPHAAAGYATTCASCHGTTAWRGSGFAHTTRFPLTGAHLAASCLGCHGDGVYAGKSAECASCHQVQYTATTRPPHGPSGIGTRCTDCHTTAAWPGATYNHDATAFPLTGAHRASTCDGCHADRVYRGKPSSCVSCHRPDYDAAKAPSHAGFPTECAACHATTTWTGGTFDHATTAFPLTGAHRAAGCQLCHGDGVYRGKPSTCASCHQADYTATTRPPHGSSGIGTTCTSCHTTAAWLPGTYDHSATAFPLTGAHTTATCAGCHADGTWRGKPSTCVSCHQSDYNQTTNPNHASASFPTACASCHTTATWLGATFDHDGQYFPIYSGKHRGKWTTCATCHTSPNNYKAFTCLTCHEHRQSAMDDKHKGRSGYSYTSQACLSCHPTGRS